MPRRSKDRNQDVRGQKLAYILHRFGVTAEMLHDNSVGDETIHLAESIAGLETHASAETLAMCAEFLATMEDFDRTLKLDGFDCPYDHTPIICEGRFGYVGAANEDLDEDMPIKTSVRGAHDGRSVTVRVKLNEDGALELASRMVSVARKVMAEKRAAVTREITRR